MNLFKFIFNKNKSSNPPSEKESDDKFDKIIFGRICPYCNCETELVTDKDIYGKNSTYGGFYYRCILNKDHYVGCYRGTKNSLGRLADKRLRMLKSQGHEIFDPLWKDYKYFPSRLAAYQWLSEKMGIEKKYTHFGMFTDSQCEKAISIIEEYISTRNK